LPGDHFELAPVELDVAASAEQAAALLLPRARDVSVL
jgi:hypothetical protein